MPRRRRLLPVAALGPLPPLAGVARKAAVPARLLQVLWGHPRLQAWQGEEQEKDASRGEEAAEPASTHIASKHACHSRQL